MVGSGVRRWVPHVIALALILTGCIRIAATWKVFSHTSDEPAHLACGLEWWARGTSDSEYQHPPISRIAIAAGPVLQGQRWSGELDMWVEGKRVLYSGDYLTNLAAARAGVLPFFVLASAVTFLWTLELFGAWPAVVAVLIFTNIPPVLAHSGLATADMAAAATYLLGVYTLDRWLVLPTRWRTAVAGLGVGMAVMTKMSAMPFLGVSLVPLVLLRRRHLVRTHLWTAGLIVTIVVLFTFACYRFSMEPVTYRASVFTQIPGASPAVHSLQIWLQTAPKMIAQPVLGVLEAASHVKQGHAGYLFGEVRIYGWWYYYPVALAVKTPVLVLFLMAMGVAMLVWQRRLGGRESLPLWVMLAVLLFCSRSTINLGVRHVLALYCFFAMLGAFAVASVWAVREVALRATVVVLLGWFVVQVARVHPDYLPYFNVSGDTKPEDILVDSDLDWGQDALRLCQWAKENNVQDMAFLVFTGIEPRLHGFRQARFLAPHEQAKGWVARSVTYKKMRNIEAWKAYEWLNHYQPVARVGKSIEVFYIP